MLISSSGAYTVYTYIEVSDCTVGEWSRCHREVRDSMVELPYEDRGITVVGACKLGRLNRLGHFG